MKMLVKITEVLVQIVVAMMAPTAFRRHRERGEESPPSSSNSLTFPLDGRRVSPLVHSFHGGGGERAPLRLDQSLCLSLFLRSLILPFHRFLNSRGSVTPIGLEFGHDFYLDIGFLAAKEGHQPPYGVATRAQGASDPLGRAPHPRGPLEQCLALIPLPKIHTYSKKISITFYPIWTLFDMDFLRNKKHATNRNQHRALNQYVSPKNSIKSCQKYVKVVEY